MKSWSNTNCIGTSTPDKHMQTHTHALTKKLRLTKVIEFQTTTHAIYPAPARCHDDSGSWELTDGRCIFWGAMQHTLSPSQRNVQCHIVGCSVSTNFLADDQTHFTYEYARLASSSNQVHTNVYLIYYFWAAVNEFVWALFRINNLLADPCGSPLPSPFSFFLCTVAVMHD